MRYLGTSDDVTDCDCCGRKDLKSTVAIETAEGHTVYYGVVCAAKALKTTSKVVKAETKKVDDAKAEEERKAQRARQDAHMAEWTAFLVKATNGGITAPGLAHHGPDIFLMIEALGGIKVARELFAASKAS